MRFSRRQIVHFPRFPACDPYVSAPGGAEIYWPPLHTWIVLGIIKLFGIAQPELGAAWVDPVVASVEMITLGCVAWRLFGRGSALLLVGTFALLPAAVFSAPGGSADHHVHEPFFVALICLLLGAAFAHRSMRLAISVGVVLGLSRLFTPVEPLFVVSTAGACLAGVLFGLNVAALAAAIGIAAASVLASDAAAFGHLSSLAYEPLSGFHPLFALALFCGGAACSRQLARSWRVFLASIALLAAVMLLPELMRAASHLGRLDPILSEVGESKPMNWSLATSFFSAALVGAPLAALGVWRRVRAGRIEGLPALVAVLVLLPVALQQIRFAQALSGAVAVLLTLGLPAAFEGLRRAALLRSAAFALGGLAFIGALAPLPPDSWDLEVALLRPSMEWLRKHTPAASADPMGDDRPSYAVVANPLLGHFLTLWAERPAVATTFSQVPVYVAGTERSAHVFSAKTDDEAYAAMREADGRYLVLNPWLHPSGHPEVKTSETQVSKLFQGDLSGSGHFQLIHDSHEHQLLPSDDGEIAFDATRREVRIFESVPGALLEGIAEPNAHVVARLALSDKLDARFNYVRETRSDATGHFSLRVAYPASADSPYSVETGTQRLTATVPPEAIEHGKTITVR